MVIMNVRGNGRDLELRFYPRTDVSFPLVCETGGAERRVVHSRNLSRKGIEVDLTLTDVEAIRAGSEPDALFPGVILHFGEAATRTPIDGLRLTGELFRLRRTSQSHYVGFFRFTGPGQEFETVIRDALRIFTGCD